MKRDLTRCRTCALFHRGFVAGEGPTPSSIMLVGESPGTDESFKSHRPFTGGAGKELDIYLSKAGIAREECYLTYLVKCNTPESRDPSKEELEGCLTHLREEIRVVNPHVIVTLGAVPLSVFYPGQWLERAWGIPFKSTQRWGERWIFPLYHPALGLHQTAMMAILAQGFRRLADWMGGGLEWEADRMVVDYRKAIKATPSVWEGYGEGNELLVAVDTETKYDGTPLYLQMSREEGKAILVEADDSPMVAIAKGVLESPTTTTVLHNSMFDLEVLHQMGIHPPTVVDTMVMSYLLQDLPQGLKPLSYRLAGMDMQDYNEVLGSVPEEKALSYLEEVASINWPNPPPQVEVKGGNVKVVAKPLNIGKKVKRAIKEYKEGKTKSLVERWAKMGGKEEVVPVVGEMPGADLRDVDPTAALCYSCRDADSTLRVYLPLLRRIRKEGLTAVLEADMGAIPMVIEMQRNGILIDLPKFEEISKMFGERMVEIERELTQLLGYAINPGSPPQVADMMTKRKIVGKVKLGKSGAQSTSVQVMEPLKAKYREIALIMEWRKYETLKTSFADTIPLKADKDGRVRTTLRVTRVVTGRLSSSNPNLMAQPVRSEEARMVRDGFVATPGWVLASFDYSQVEMRITAHCSGDKAMTNIFLTNQDIHSMTASRMFGLPIDKLDEMLHRYPAKRTGFGILNVISPDGLLREMETGGARGWTREKCVSMIEDWFFIYSGVRNWIEESKASARRFGKVWDLFGRYRLVPEIWSSERRIVEDGLRQAVNAPIQMGAQGVIKRAMGWIHQLLGKESCIRPLIQIHDDLLFEIRKEEVGWAVPTIREVMEGCVALSIPTPVDPKVGERWGSMKKWKGVEWWENEIMLK